MSNGGKFMAESEYSIAIIGMEGRFPKANNVENFWENLKKCKRLY